MIGELKSDYSIDASRVYMTGYSIGASMTITFAFKFTDVLAAIAPVSSAWMTNDSMYDIDPYSVPQPKAPIPVYLWRGDQESWPSLEEDQSQMRYWIALNHANNTPTTVASGIYKTEIYAGGDAEARHTEIAGRGHATSYDHTTARMIWFDFFMRFSREADQIKEQPPSAQG
jgi:polyhydroxybutyrate depolymerase